MISRRAAIVSVATIALATLGAGCSASVSVGNGDPAERVYTSALAQPSEALTTAASASARTCAGGEAPDQNACMTNTDAQITAANDLIVAMQSVPTPDRYAAADAALQRGLKDYVAGLTERNAGLAEHSTARYAAGDEMMRKSLDVQKAAFAKYPADADIIP